LEEGFEMIWKDIRGSRLRVAGLYAATLVLTTSIGSAYAQSAIDTQQSAAQSVAALQGDTRAAEIATRQIEKARALTQYRPSGAERFLSRLEESFASPPNGFYPAFGSVYPGGGFTPGVGYRHFYGREAVWDIVGLYSVKNYKAIEIGTRVPWNGVGNLNWGVRTGWRDATQVGFFGIGMEQPSPRANFRLTQTYGALSAEIRPTRWTRLLGEVAYERYDTDEGAGRQPSIEVVYTTETAPGLFASPTFVRTEGTIAIDWRTSPGYSRKGGFYGVTLANLAARNDANSFQRLEGEIIQHFPLLRENWVISVRGRVQTTLDDDDLVPYFLLPQLGSGRTLRGYETGRFRDRHSLLTSAEFRWVPSRLALDMALFYDAGKVAPFRSELDFKNLANDWGVGVRFHGPTATVLRVEAARGSDGWRLVFASAAAF
jgi:hypothetical protein